MFDSPFVWCAHCGEMVLLDQTQRECAREHQCGDRSCPFGNAFTGIDFQPTVRAQPKEPRHDRRQ